MNTEVLNLNLQKFVTSAINLSVVAAVFITAGSFTNSSPPISAREMRIAQGGGSKMKRKYQNKSRYKKFI